MYSTNPNCKGGGVVLNLLRLGEELNKFLDFVDRWGGYSCERLNKCKIYINWECGYINQGMAYSGVIMPTQF